jgi:hypothetical protein
MAISKPRRCIYLIHILYKEVNILSWKRTL